jgi:hypothetical protein
MQIGSYTLKRITKKMYDFISGQRRLFNDDGAGYGYGLWRSNGTPGSASLVKTGMIPCVTGCNCVVLNVLEKKRKTGCIR